MKNDGAATRDALVRVFARFDKNEDGAIDEEEFAEMLESLGWHSPVEVRSLEFAAIDGNSDGLVEFPEFSEWWLDRN
jgi:Ca2+-binding EF-hand superfamily protein